MKKKRMLSIVLALCMVLTMLPLTGLTAFAATSGDFKYRVLSETDKTCEITGHTGSATTLDIPAKLDGYTVTSIGEYAFYKCSSLTSITIPNGVTSIGDDAFYFCASLESVTIGDSVTSIGEYAFFKCSSLTSITIPNGVTSIEDYTFCYCDSLKSITIPSSVTSIRAFAFFICDALESIVIPDSVASIGDRAFCFCESLTSITVASGNPNYSSENGILFNKDKTKLIQYPAGKTDTAYTIPSSVTSIGAFAFPECDSLTSITIPDSVTSIGDYAFCSCESLTSITIPDSVTRIGECAFYFCASLANITIPDSVTSIGKGTFFGCDNFTIYGYAGSYAETYAIDNGIPFVDIPTGLVTTGTLTRGNVAVTIFDKTAFLEGSINFIEANSDAAHHKLGGVLLTAGSAQQTVDGNAVLTAQHVGKTVTFSKAGYQNYIIPAQVVTSWFGSDRLQARNIYMAADKQDGKPYIAGAFAREADEDAAYTDLQSEQFTVMADTAYDVILTAATGGAAVETYVLSQDSAHRLSSRTGVFSAETLADTFAAGKDVYAYVQTTDGKTSEPAKLNMQVTELRLSGDTFSLIGQNGQSIKFDQDTPLVGGATLSLDGFTFPFGIEVEGDRFKISFGVDLFSAKQGSDGTVTKQGAWESFKKSISTLQDSTESATKKLQRYKNFVNTFAPGQTYLEQGKNFDTSFLGYAEGYFVNGQPVITDSCGEVAAKFTFQYTYQGTIWIIPVYAYVKAGASAAVKIQGVRALPDTDVPLDFGLSLAIEPELTVGGGIGVKGAISGGVYGKGSLPFQNNFTTRHTVVQLSGELGVEGELFCFSGKKTLIDGTVTLYDGYYGNARSRADAILQRMQQTTVPKDANASEQTAETVTTVLPRDYAEHTSQWLGSNFFRKYAAAGTNAAGGLTVKELQTSVFQNSQTQLVSLDDGTMMMAWIEDDSARDTYNRMRLVYSIYKNGSWSKPKAVADDGTNDGYPSLATDGKTVYIAWQNISRALTEADADSIDAVLQNSEICIAKYNASGDSFQAATQLTDNTKYDYAPSLAVENAQAVLYWEQSANNDLTVAGSNTLYRYTTATGSTTTVKTGLNYMPDMVCTISDGVEEVAFSMDADGDLSTTEDVYAYTLSNGALTQQTPQETDSAADFAVTYGMLDGETTLFFADRNGVYYRQDGEIQSVFSDSRTVNGDLQVLENGNKTDLLWTEISDAGTELWMCSYENGAWSYPVQISNTGALLHDVSAVYHNGVIHGVLDRTARTLESEEYVSGQTDLCYFTVSDFSDIEASFITVDESGFVPGEDTQIPVWLKNNGTEDISSVEITLQDGLGTETTVRQNVELASGAESIVYIVYAVPENYGKATLSVSVNIPNVDETTAANNRDSVEIGSADIAVSEVSVNDVGEYYVFTAVVQNSNPVPAQDVQINIYSDDADGDLLDFVNVGDLQVGEMRTVQYIVQKDTMQYDENGLGKICFSAETADEENIQTDNRSYAVFEQIDETEPTVTLGDVNADGKVDAVDARWVLQAAAGMRTLENATAADVNTDGKIDAVDARWILQAAAGMRTL